MCGPTVRGSEAYGSAVRVPVVCGSVVCGFVVRIL